MSTAIAHQQTEGWQAELTLHFAARANKTVLAERHRHGPLAIQRPFYPEDDVCHAYILHPPGGVVGGDQLNINLYVEANSHALLTTPGATKFYRSGGQQAHQQQHFNVSGALEWLPQENIFFPGANSRLSTHIYLEADAAYIGWEVQCLGRPVINERFKKGQLILSTHLYRDDAPLFVDCLSIGCEQDLHGIAALRGHPVMATMLATPATQGALELVRPLCEVESIQGHAGVTLMNDVLIVRYLGDSTAEAHELLRTAWKIIRPLVANRSAVTPRIWNT